MTSDPLRAEATRLMEEAEALRRQWLTMSDSAVALTSKLALSHCANDLGQFIDSKLRALLARLAPQAPPTTDDYLGVGDVIDLGVRRVRILGNRDGVTLCRDGRMRIAVQDVYTNRLSYVPEWRLRGNRKTLAVEGSALPEHKT